MKNYENNDIVLHTNKYKSFNKKNMTNSRSNINLDYHKNKKNKNWTITSVLPKTCGNLHTSNT